MNKTSFFGLVALGAAALVFGCDDSNDRQKNPSFSTGGSQQPGAGQGAGGEAGSAGQPGPEGGQPIGGAGGTTPAGEAGAGGTPALEPPYDCVLEPQTHLEIINACTDAVRIEKSPALPPIP